jgi:hypothetical protein
MSDAGGSEGGASGASSGGGDVEAKLAVATALKDEGNALYKAGAVGEAMWKWFDLIGRLASLDKGRAASAGGDGMASALAALGNGGGGPPLTPEQQRLVDELTVSVHLNMAAALLKARVRAACVREHRKWALTRSPCCAVRRRRSGSAWRSTAPRCWQWSRPT